MRVQRPLFMSEAGSLFLGAFVLVFARGLAPEESGASSEPAPSSSGPVPGPFLRITSLSEKTGPVTFRIGATRPEQVHRTFHIIRVFGHLSRTWSPAPESPNPWEFREEVTSSSSEPVKLQAPAPSKPAEAELTLGAGGEKTDPGLEVEGEGDPLSEKDKPQRYLEKDEDGKPQWEAFYKNGIAVGAYTVWHPNGQKRLKGQFKDNLWHGTFTEWDEHGQIVSIREFSEGLLVKSVPMKEGKAFQENLEVLDFKYHQARMEKGYLPVPIGASGKDWRQTIEACTRERLLPTGEASASVDLGALLPYGERRYHLYVRAFVGEQLVPARLPIRLELFGDRGAKSPVSSIETDAGFKGLLLTGLGSDSPRLETIEGVIDRWKEETRQVLARRPGREIFVSPQGSPTGKGTKDSPLALQTILYPAVCPDPARPGDTVWLLEGTYQAPGWATSEANTRIARMKRTARPEEIPGAGTSGPDDEPAEEEIEKELAAEKEEPENVGSNELPWVTDPSEEIKPFLDYYFESRIEGTPESPIIVRQYPGHHAVLHGGLNVAGKNVWFWGFEITEPDERANREAAKPSVTAMAPGCRFINLHTHRGGQGFAFWSSAPDSEIYGCVIHDFGYGGNGDRGHGHAIYTQNDHGMKRIIDNVMFHGLGWNFHAYTQGGEVFNYYIEGNFSFSAGMKQPGQVTDNWLIMTWKPAHRMYFIGNIGYHPLTFTRGVRFGSYGHDTELVLRGNDFYGSSQAMSLGRWQSVECVGNSFWARNGLVNAKPEQEGLHPDAYSWDRNSYHVPAPAPGPAFEFNGKGGSFEEWKKLSGYDGNSQAFQTPDGRPQAGKVVVRPNFYEPGRAHIAVLNWERKESVEADFSTFLEKGREFQVFHVLDLEEKGLKAPVVEGEFDGAPVRLPLKRSALSPDLDVFLVLSK